ncbi:MAG TPA: hypothetical protein VN722_04790 [Hanamia sp.]|nr:hypothetical protein [Hanamia sp.]
MKKVFFLIAVISITCATAYAQEAYTQQMKATVTRLDNANAVKDYEQLANDFLRIATVQKTQWLPYYYAAFCNAKVGWLKQTDDPDNIESFADKAAQEINKAQSLIDTTKQRKELSEIYCVQMMLNQARVFMNPQTYGPRFGRTAFNYLELAKQANPDNPRMLYLLGWQKLTTPKMWGGDKVLAKQLLTEAKQKLETQPSPGIGPHWGKNEADGLLKQLK